MIHSIVTPVEILMEETRRGVQRFKYCSLTRCMLGNRKVEKEKKVNERERKIDTENITREKEKLRGKTVKETLIL